MGTETRNAEVESVEETEDATDVSLERKILIGSIVSAIVGSFLPWVTVFGVTVYGVEGDGILTLILAIIAAAVGYYWNFNKRAAIAGAIAGLLIVLIALFSVTGAAAIGVYLTLLGGIGMLLTGTSMYRKLP